MSLVIASYNLGDGPDANKARDLDRIATSGAHVICLQEAGDRHDMLDAWASRAGWSIRWYGRGPLGADSVPILVRNGTRVVNRHARMAVDRIYVGRGAGPSWAKPKVVQVVRVIVDGKPVVVMNTHMVASAGRRGHMSRKAHYRQHVAALVRMVERRIRRGVPVVVVGDFNGVPNFPLLDPLRAAKLHQHNHQPTHGRRCIDHVWTHGVRVEGVRLLSLSSDHKAVLATITRRKP